jgi:hypothetical protein
MENIAPDIFRQRLLIEGYYTIDVSLEIVQRFLLSLAEAVDLRTYGMPIAFSPESGMGKEENQGFDAFIPLVDSGISVYIWSKSRFFSVVVYSCKGFDEEEAVAFARDFFEVTDAPVSMSF